MEPATNRVPNIASLEHLLRTESVPVQPIGVDKQTAADNLREFDWKVEEVTKSAAK